MYVRTYVHTYVRTNVHTYVCTCVRACVRAYVRTYVTPRTDYNLFSGEAIKICFFWCWVFCLITNSIRFLQKY